MFPITDYQHKEAQRLEFARCYTLWRLLSFWWFRCALSAYQSKMRRCGVFKQEHKVELYTSSRSMNTQLNFLSHDVESLNKFILVVCLSLLKKKITKRINYTCLYAVICILCLQVQPGSWGHGDISPVILMLQMQICTKRSSVCFTDLDSFTPYTYGQVSPFLEPFWFFSGMVPKADFGGGRCRKSKDKTSVN